MGNIQVIYGNYAENIQKIYKMKIHIHEKFY